MPGSTTQRRPATSSSTIAVQMLGAVDDQRLVDGLPALRRAAAARQHADALLARQREARSASAIVARHDDAHRHHLVVGCVGGVAPAVEGVEQDLAGDLGLQPPLQARASVRPPSTFLDRHHAARLSLKEA